MNNEDAYVYKLLKKAGWHEGRELSYERISEMVKNEGYPQLPNVIRFLQGFMDIKIIFKNKRNGIKNDDINFSFEEATDLEVPERVNEEYSQRVGKELCLIGSVFRRHMVLMMSDDMCVYGGYDNYLCKIGDSGIDAIKAIVYNQDSVPIP
jgi:hypothetical protein